MSTLLLVLALSRCVLTLPGNLIFVLQSFWPLAHLRFKDTRAYRELGAVSEVLFCLNYSKNFYLYCVTHKDIRLVTSAKLKKLRKTVMQNLNRINFLK